MSKNKGVGKFLAGICLGAGLGVLLAPKSGKETRKDLKNSFDTFVNSLKDIDVNEVKDEFLSKLEDIRNELEDLDREKVQKIAEKKVRDLKVKADELVELAKEKGTPIIEEAADTVRQKTIEVTKGILEKLEQK